MDAKSRTWKLSGHTLEEVATVKAAATKLQDDLARMSQDFMSERQNILQNAAALVQRCHQRICASLNITYEPENYIYYVETSYLEHECAFFMRIAKPAPSDSDVEIDEPATPLGMMASPPKGKMN